eukprot:358180-Chlamydomonas_euryale.AAC.6
MRAVRPPRRRSFAPLALDVGDGPAACHRRVCLAGAAVCLDRHALERNRPVAGKRAGHTAKARARAAAASALQCPSPFPPTRPPRCCSRRTRTANGLALAAPSHNRGQRDLLPEAGYPRTACPSSRAACLDRARATRRPPCPHKLGKSPCECGVPKRARVMTHADQPAAPAAARPGDASPT